MTNRYISTLSAVRKNDINRVGGKGANLGELAGKGFPVPSGFVVSAEAYSIFFTSLRLQKILHSLNKAGKNELSRACGVIRNTITNASFPGELAESILAAHQRLIGNRIDETVCAVRSSATTEDISEASFAGQHATYYYVERANLLRMIQYCWASLWSKEAVSYRNACGIEHSAAMAVVIQEMVRSEISGITFTANPVTCADEIVIEASWGMGAAIVDGRVTPDRYTLDHDTLQLLDQRIAEKSVMVPNKLQTETSSRLTEVPLGLQQQQTLNLELLETVATWALKAEKYFESPQNMEWAVSDGHFYILQSRPISPVDRRNKQLEPKGKYILFKPAINSPAEPFTPLTADLFSLATSPLLRSIHGHCYFDLKYIRPLFPFQFSDLELVNLFSGLNPKN
ncbi:PEP/pyruvate-binding domain-containing protein, partial [Desulfobulbus sp. US4]|nr:PEP/pyruvate-binding domain-containing protein [Desulfobulbus sp. US4]